MYWTFDQNSNSKVLQYNGHFALEKFDFLATRKDFRRNMFTYVSDRNDLEMTLPAPGAHLVRLKSILKYELTSDSRNWQMIYPKTFFALLEYFESLVEKQM